MKKTKIIYRICIGTIYFLLLIFFSLESLKSGNASGETSNNFANIIFNTLSFIFNKNIYITETTIIFIRKLVGHFLYFSVLGIVSILFFYSFYNYSNFNLLFFLNYLSGFGFAFITEFVFQNLADERFPSMEDVIIDCTGFLFFSIFLLKYFFYKNIEKSTNF